MVTDRNKNLLIKKVKETGKQITGKRTFKTKYKAQANEMDTF